jgi:hypothetical protein
MHIVLISFRGRYRQCENPEEKLSRHTVRPGT